MPVQTALNFFIYCMVNAFTPGPGNILALNTVTNYGYRNGRPLFFGIFAGYYAVQTMCAVLVYGVSAMLPGMMGVLKYLGAAYILWLAFHIAIGKPAEERTGKSASFLKGFALQLVNVKIYMFGITALTGYVVTYWSSFSVLLLFEMAIATIGTIATSTWIGAGLLLQKVYLKHYRVMNVAFALILLECAWSMVAS